MQPNNEQSVEGYQYYTLDEIKELVRQPKITFRQMQDAVISCTVDIKTNSIRRNPDPKIRNISADTISEEGYNLFRQAFSELDVPFGNASPEEINEILLEIEKKWKLNEMDRDLQQSHRFLCQQLILKAMGPDEGE